MAGSGTAHLRDPDETLLRAENLVVEFPVGSTGLKVHAVTDVSIDVREGETLGLVGESGLRQVDHRPGAHAAAPPDRRRRCIYDGQDLTKLKGDDLRQVRPEMQMIFQDPISSLNPRRKVGDIVAEPLRIWKRGTTDEQRQIVNETLEAVGLDPEAAVGPAPPPVLRRPVPAHLHRPLAGARPQADHLRRAGLGPRRVGAGPDPEPARGHEGSATGSRWCSSPTTWPW